MTTTDNHNHDPNAASLAGMSAHDFAQWGVDFAAYVKTVDVVGDNGETTGDVAYSIHAADGRHLGFAPTRELAFVAIRREEMEPVSVH